MSVDEQADENDEQRSSPGILQVAQATEMDLARRGEPTVDRGQNQQPEENGAGREDEIGASLADPADVVRGIGGPAGEDACDETEIDGDETGDRRDEKEEDARDFA